MACSTLCLLLYLVACFNLTSTAVLRINVCSHHGARPTAHLTNTRLNLPPGSLSHVLRMYTRISTHRDFPHLCQRLRFLPPQIPITVPVYSQGDNTAIYRCRKSKATGGGSVCRHSSSRKTYTLFASMGCPAPIRNTMLSLRPTAILHAAAAPAAPQLQLHYISYESYFVRSITVMMAKIQLNRAQRVSTRTQCLSKHKKKRNTKQAVVGRAPSTTGPHLSTYNTPVTVWARVGGQRLKQRSRHPHGAPLAVLELHGQPECESRRPPGRSPILHRGGLSLLFTPRHSKHTGPPTHPPSSAMRGGDGSISTWWGGNRP